METCSDMTKSPETTVRQQGVAAYWDDYAGIKTEHFGKVIWPSWQDALRHVAAEARRMGAPGQALVFDEYDAQYLLDRVVVIWNTPVMSEQPKDKRVVDFDGSIPKTYKTVSTRLGNIPQ
jgi:hypothetical protein